MTRAAGILTSYVLGIAVALAIMLAWSIVAGCGGAIDASDAEGMPARGSPSRTSPVAPASACDADAREYRTVCAAQGAPTGFAFAGACLREVPPSGYPRNNLFGPNSGGGVPFDSAGLHSQFLGGCRGVGGYTDWRNDTICCP